jgi:hypothetical protein
VNLLLWGEGLLAKKNDQIVEQGLTNIGDKRWGEVFGQVNA